MENSVEPIKLSNDKIYEVKGTKIFGKILGGIDSNGEVELVTTDGIHMKFSVSDLVLKEEEQDLIELLNEVVKKLLLMGSSINDIGKLIGRENLEVWVSNGKYNPFKERKNEKLDTIKLINELADIGTPLEEINEMINGNKKKI